MLVWNTYIRHIMDWKQQQEHTPLFMFATVAQPSRGIPSQVGRGYRFAPLLQVGRVIFLLGLLRRWRASGELVES